MLPLLQTHDAASAISRTMAPVRAAIVLTAVGLLAVPVRASARDCIADSETAQRERTDGHLRKARDLFKACAAAECPQSVRSDCERSFDDVDRAMPSIVVIARAQGRDVTDVRVVIDDLPMADKLDGNALVLDPGTHRLRLENASGGVLAEREIVAHAAEKNRIVEFAVAPPPPPPSPDAPSVEESRHGAGPWIIVSIGLAGMIAGGVMFGVGASEQSHSREGCTTNTDGSLTCNPPQTTSDGQNRASLDSNGTTLLNVGVIAFGGGAAFLIGGVVWHFLERPHKRAVAVTPLVSPSFTGLTLDARF